MSRFSVKIVLYHSTESFRRGTFLCFIKFRVSTNFLPKRGKSRFSIENLLSHSTEKLRRGTFCNRNFSGWKGGCLKSRGSITIFCKNFFISQSRKRSSGTLLFFRKFRVSRFFMIKRGLSQFLIKKFVVSQYRRTS